MTTPHLELSGRDVAHAILALAVMRADHDPDWSMWPAEMHDAVNRVLSLTTVTPIIEGSRYAHIRCFRLNSRGAEECEA
jgi:hypothetical protein